MHDVTFTVDYISANSIGVLLSLGVGLFFAGFFIIYRVTKNVALSYLLSFLKAIFFLVYFFSLENIFTLSDDLAYFKTALSLYQSDFSFMSLFNDFASDFKTQMGSRHILYILQNLIAIKVIGVYYFSPVAINIILIYLAAWFAYKILRELGFQQKAASIFFIFFAFHPEMLSWSILNIKDFLIIFLVNATIYLILRIDKYGLTIARVCGLPIMFWLLYHSRFYLLFFLLVSYIMYRILLWYFSLRDVYLKILLIYFGALLLPVILIFLHQAYSYEYDIFISYFSNPLIGVIRFLLSPVPFLQSPEYNFILPAAVWHWLIAPFFVWGIIVAVRNIKSSPFILFLLLYLVCLTLFYGSFAELQGPRHRLQLALVIYFLQFIGIRDFYLEVITSRSRLTTH
jgi:hypothetical protein